MKIENKVNYRNSNTSINIKAGMLFDYKGDIYIIAQVNSCQYNLISIDGTFFWGGLKTLSEIKDTIIREKFKHIENAKIIVEGDSYK